MRASIARVTGGTEAAGMDALLDAAAELNITDLSVVQTDLGKTIISGRARYHLDRERLFEVIKQFDGWESHVVLDLTVERDDVRGFHTVQRGETLASIAQRYLGTSAREMEIFEANRDRMNDPDQIMAGQQLLIPWR